MFRFFLLVVAVLGVSAFSPMRFTARSKLSMAAEQPALKKYFGAALIASTLIGSGVPAFAKEGAGAKIGIFTNSGMSSPFTDEKREDPIFSPYSPYGDGSKAAYNERKGSPEEIKSWSDRLENSIKRVDKVPGYVAKKTWLEISAELTRYTYEMRKAMLILASNSKDVAGATAAAKNYFVDLNDMTEWAKKKNGPVILAAFEKSKNDMATFKAFLK